MTDMSLRAAVDVILSVAYSVHDGRPMPQYIVLGCLYRLLFALRLRHSYDPVKDFRSLLLPFPVYGMPYLTPGILV